MRRLLAALCALLISTPALAQSTGGGAGGGSGTVTSVVCPSATITTTGSCSPLPTAGTSGDVVTAAGSNGAQDSGTLLSTLAPLASPALTGTPTAPTPTTSDNSTKIATTAYVQANVGGGGGFVAPAAISGHWYMPPFLVTAVGTAMTTARMICQEQINFAPAYTVKALGFRITTLGTSYTQAAVYANAAGKPNGAPLGFTSGTDGANLGLGLINGPLTDAGASGSTFTLPTGMYWTCEVSNDSVVVLNAMAAAETLTSAFVGSATQATMNTASASAGMSVFQAITCNASAATGCTFPTVTSSGWTEAASQTQGGVVMNQAN